MNNQTIGNDDYLFGLPANLDEAVDTFIDYYKSVPDFHEIVKMNEKKFAAYAHHGSGQFIRNSWFLWWQPKHNYPEWPATIPPLVKYFNDRGIMHADDMSGIIITTAHRRMNGKPH